MSRLFGPRLRTYLGVLALIGTLLTVPATSASASTFPVRRLWETFEGSSAATWTFSGTFGCCGHIEDDAFEAHSGTKSAYIGTPSPAGSWYSVGKLVYLGSNQHCQARLWVSHVGAVNIEVINPSNWTYVALSSLSGGSIYQSQFLNWYGGPRDVYFRVSSVSTDPVLNPWAHVDDITIDCS